jgi:MFS superfamily sulfate permease-like transporter
MTTAAFCRLPRLLSDYKAVNYVARCRWNEYFSFSALLEGFMLAPPKFVPGDGLMPDREPRLTERLRSDVLAGFLVFLIALPLCLAIAKASGFPEIAGVFTAIVGGLVAPWISNSQLTIKGPAAGMIVIVLGAVTDFGFTQTPQNTAEIANNLAAYKMALAVGVVAAGVQILFGLFRVGSLGDFFPSSAVHGLLAAIGIIIISKQVPVALGVTPHGKEPLELLAEIPQELLALNPEIAAIGFISLLILFLFPWIKNPIIRKIPAPIVVLAAAVPLALFFDLTHQHDYTVLGHHFTVNNKFLVNVPSSLASAITLPDFSVFTHPALAWKALKWVVMFTLIGSLESLLSAKAIDILDPLRRKTDLNRDLLAVGVANLASASIGGLPMISEIVRSRANIDNGAQSKFANTFHGLFLLTAVALAASTIRMIPLAALAAMLVYTGFRLAHPREFLHVYRIGREQLVVFVGTILAVLATDLLIGIGIGIAIKLLIQFINGVPLKSLFFPDTEVRQIDERTWLICPRHAAVFFNWIPIRSKIERYGLAQNMNIIVDLSNTQMVDHTVMVKLHELERQFAEQGIALAIVGLEDHITLSPHPAAARLRGVDRPAAAAEAELIANET